MLEINVDAVNGAVTRPAGKSGPGEHRVEMGNDDSFVGVLLAMFAARRQNDGAAAIVPAGAGLNGETGQVEQDGTTSGEPAIPTRPEQEEDFAGDYPRGKQAADVSFPCFGQVLGGPLWEQHFELAAQEENGPARGGADLPLAFAEDVPAFEPPSPPLSTGDAPAVSEQLPDIFLPESEVLFHGAPDLPLAFAEDVPAFEPPSPPLSTGDAPVASEQLPDFSLLEQMHPPPEPIGAGPISGPDLSAGEGPPVTATIPLPEEYPPAKPSLAVSRPGLGSIAGISVTLREETVSEAVLPANPAPEEQLAEKGSFHPGKHLSGPQEQGREPHRLAQQPAVFPVEGLPDGLPPEEDTGAAVERSGDGEVMSAGSARFATVAGGREGALSAAGLSPTDVMNQVWEHMALFARPGVREVRLQLQPEHLGNILIRLRSVRGVLSAEILTPHLAVKELLEGQWEHLSRRFQEMDLRVEEFRVLVGDGGSQEGRGGAQDAPGAPAFNHYSRAKKADPPAIETRAAPEGPGGRHRVDYLL